jgi:hypothetical protein
MFIIFVCKHYENHALYINDTGYDQLWVKQREYEVDCISASQYRSKYMGRKDQQICLQTNRQRRCSEVFYQL